jgi:hypothetical protein
MVARPRSRASRLPGGRGPDPPAGDHEGRPYSEQQYMLNIREKGGKYVEFMVDKAEQ